MAGEVRNLAVRSADAAKKTAVLIEGTVGKINDGNGSAGRAEEAFQRVAEGGLKVGKIGEVAAALG